MSRVYGGVSAEDRQGSRRSELIEAAVDLMYEQGIDALTVRKVAAATGLSPRYLYESFRDLEDLRCAAFDDTVDQVVQHALGAVLDAPDNLPARVEALLAALVGYADDHPNRARLALTSAYGAPTLVARRHAMSRNLARAFGEFVQLHLAQPVAQDRIRLASRMLVGATAEVIVARLDSDSDMSTPDLIPTMTAMFLSVLDGVQVDAPLSKGTLPRAR